MVRGKRCSFCTRRLLRKRCARGWCCGWQEGGKREVSGNVRGGEICGAHWAVRPQGTHKVGGHSGRSFTRRYCTYTVLPRFFCISVVSAFHSWSPRQLLPRYLPNISDHTNMRHLPWSASTSSHFRLGNYSWPLSSLEHGQSNASDSATFFRYLIFLDRTIFQAHFRRSQSRGQIGHAASGQRPAYVTQRGKGCTVRIAPHLLASECCVASISKNIDSHRTHDWFNLVAQLSKRRGFPCSSSCYGACVAPRSALMKL